MEEHEQDFTYVRDKDEIRQLLKIEYVCKELGVLLTRDLRALCPIHENDGLQHDPSFYLWDGDDGVRRWWCQPCGRGGDIFDLISELRGVPFPEAIRQANDMLNALPPGYELPTIELRTTDEGPETWGAQVLAARERAARPDHHGIMAAHVRYADPSDQAECARWDTYLRGTWDWGFSENGEILMPHYSAAGALTGCKKRGRMGERTSLPGSKYEDLYGSWLGVRHREVLLCEGETDAGWAAFAVAEAGLPLDVFSLPSGANSKPLPAIMQFLKPARRIYLAFDPDDAGVQATRIWLDALQESGFREVLVCPLPLGRDLRAAKPDMRRLLERAAVRVPEVTDLQANEAGMFRAKHTKDGTFWEELTPWSIEPRARIVGGDTPGYDVYLHFRGHKKPTLIRDTDLLNVNAVRRWAGKRGLGFPGTDRDLQLVASWLRARASIVPEIHQAGRVGMHLPPEGYTESEVGSTCVVPEGYLGAFPRRYAPGDHEADATGKVLLPAAGAFDWCHLVAFLALSHESITHPLLAWLVAASRRNEVRDFPMMFISGSSGVGKSTLARLALRLMGSQIEIDLGAATAFVLMRTLASSTTFPVFVDEWTRLSKKEAREALQANMPTLYAGGTVERGQADLSTARFRITAPTIIAGEDAFTLDRELERAIPLLPSRSAQNFHALQSIQTAPLERFGDGLYRWLTEPGVRESLPSVSDPHAATRPEYNRAVLEAGWRTFLLYAQYSSAHEDVPDLPSAPDLSALDEADEQPQANIYEELLREAENLTDPKGIPVVWQDVHANRGVYIRPRQAIAAIRRAAIELDLPGGERAMMRYFAERYTVRTGLRESAPSMPLSPVSCSLIEGFRLNDYGEGI